MYISRLLFSGCFRQKIHMPAPDFHTVPEGAMGQTVKRQCIVRIIPWRFLRHFFIHGKPPYMYIHVYPLCRNMCGEDRKNKRILTETACLSPESGRYGFTVINM